MRSLVIQARQVKKQGANATQAKSLKVCISYWSFLINTEENSIDLSAIKSACAEHSNEAYQMACTSITQALLTESVCLVRNE